MLQDEIQLPFFVILLILLLAARVLGEIFEYFKQPSLIGEILAGILLGPAAFGLIMEHTPELKTFGEMGLFLLIIKAGLEIELSVLRNSIRGKNFWIAIMGFFVPFAMGLVLGWFFSLDRLVTVFLSLCISITALPVSVRILMDLKILNTSIGQRIVSAAVFNDVIALMMLGVLLQFHSSPDNTLTDIFISIGISMGKVVLFFAAVIVTYKLLFQTSQQNDSIQNGITAFMKLLKGRESMFALVFVFILVFASLSELAGLHFVVGAFFGSMMLNRKILGSDNHKQVEETTSNITMAFLAPIFFASIGLDFNFTSVDNLPLLSTILVVSFVSKIAGGIFGSRLAGLPGRDALAIGFGLNARGVIELVIASIAFQNKVIDANMFSMLVLMGMITTISTPFFLKWVLKPEKSISA